MPLISCQPKLRLTGLLWLTAALAIPWVNGLPADLRSQGEIESGKGLGQRLDAKEAAALEAKIQQLYDKLAPSVVRFFDPKRKGSGFSGVIVSPDGEILTCAHHHLPPQTKAMVELADRRRVRATILGSVKQEAKSRLRHSAADIGMARLDEKGPWPAAALRPPGDLKPGERCLALGYPNFHLPGQSPLLRFGRILPTDPLGRIRSSCRAQPGDSGGPLVDLQGRVVSVLIAMESLKTGVTMHSSVEAFIALRERLRAGEAGEFEKDLPRNFEWRKEETGWVIRPKKGTESPLRVEPWSELWGWEAAQPLQKNLSQAHRSTVEILGGRKGIALGIIVGEDGWVLTKRTELFGPGGPRSLWCRLADGRRFEAKVMAGSCEHDLALLKLGASGLPPVKWASAKGLRVSRLVASLGPGPEPIYYSVVSAVRAKNPGIKGDLPIRIEPAAAGSKGVCFAGFLQKRLDTDEVRSFLRAGDQITHLDDHPTSTLAEFNKVRDKRLRAPEGLAGEWVKLTVDREGKTQHVFLPLVAGPSPIFIPWRDSRWNRRRNGFPLVFGHDGGIPYNRCGGPVVDREGRVIGINIARADPMQTFAIPSDFVQKVIADLKAQIQKKSESK
jgi:serine protease Do